MVRCDNHECDDNNWLMALIVLLVSSPLESWLAMLCFSHHSMSLDQPQGVKLEVMEANNRLMEAIQSRNFGAFR